jgi:deazaflavin-dependent oxidoreductase (nitroreductase family)
VPIPLAVGRWNRAGFNRLSTPVARQLPGFAVVRHRGRRSGREHQTPVNLFRVGDRFVIALVYGPRTDWVRNVLAAGGCTIETRGSLVACGQPVVYRDPERHGIRPVERATLALLGVQDFLELVPLEPLEPPDLSGRRAST